MSDCETGRPLVQNQFPRIDNLGQLFQQRLNCARVRYQIVNNLCPRLVQALVPDARRKELDRVLEALAGLSDILCAFIEHGLP